MQERVIASIDVGTTKICVLVGVLERDGKLSIVGVGTCPSQGLRRGVVVNIEETVTSIAAALDRAERLSGKTITTAYVGIAGSHIDSENSKGFVAISPSHRDIVQNDISRAIEVARAIAIPANREVIHVIPRGYVVDGQEGIKNPIGMSGFRLEVETHIITGAVSSIHNLIKCVHKARVEIEDLVLEPLASSEAVLEDGETDLGIALVDIGGGTTDIAIFARWGYLANRCHTHWRATDYQRYRYWPAPADAGGGGTQSNLRSLQPGYHRGGRYDRPGALYARLQ